MVSATNRQMPSAPANQRDHRYIPRWTAATPHCATDSGGRSGQSCVALEDAVVGSCNLGGASQVFAQALMYGRRLSGWAAAATSSVVERVTSRSSLRAAAALWSSGIILRCNKNALPLLQKHLIVPIYAFILCLCRSLPALQFNSITPLQSNTTQIQEIYFQNGRRCYDLHWGVN